jgi:hypothetical protein
MITKTQVHAERKAKKEAKAKAAKDKKLAVVVRCTKVLAKMQKKQMLLLSAAKAKAAKAVTKDKGLRPVGAAVQEQLSTLNQGPSREAPMLFKDIAWEVQQLSTESLPTAPG